MQLGGLSVSRQRILYFRLEILAGDNFHLVRFIIFLPRLIDPFIKTWQNARSLHDVGLQTVQ